MRNTAPFYSYPHWYKRSNIKERISKNFQRHRGLSFEIEIRHFYQVSFSNLTTLNDQYHKTALYVDNGNIIAIHHLNGSKLHLNLKGNKDFNWHRQS